MKHFLEKNGQQNDFISWEYIYIYYLRWGSIIYNITTYIYICIWIYLAIVVTKILWLKWSYKTNMSEPFDCLAV